MSGVTGRYVLDANVFIEAYRRYYGFDLCPGFWECLLHHSGGMRVASVDRVKDELKDGEGELAEWVRGQASNVFASTEDLTIAHWYGQMIEWVKDGEQFTRAALGDFARGADGWVIAYAKATGGIVVTHEVHAPDVKRRVPIPNVCRAFEVEDINTFDMLRQLEAVFHWQRPDTSGSARGDTA